MTYLLYCIAAGPAIALTGCLIGRALEVLKGPRSQRMGDGAIIPLALFFGLLQSIVMAVVMNFYTQPGDEAAWAMFVFLSQSGFGVHTLFWAANFWFSH